MTTYRLLPALILATLIPSAAHARRVFISEPATDVHVITYTLGALEKVKFETTNLSARADTVLHLWDPDTNTELAYSDNRSTYDRSSVLEYKNSLGRRTVRLIVRAASATTHGTAVLKRNGVSLGTVAVGGTFLTTPCGSNSRVYTAHRPFEADDTRLLGLTSGGRLRGYNDNDGVEATAVLPQRSDYCRVVLGKRPNSAPGAANVYVVDTGSDSDGDGLGNAFEAEYGTCSTTSCAFNPKDSDRDGLTDFAELLGIDHASTPQNIPAWGADPLHKDMFVEIDYHDTFPAMPLTVDDLWKLQAYFAGGAAADLGNPDNAPGIALHFDVSHLQPTDRGQARLFGNRGGSNAVPASVGYQAASSTQRIGLRAGVFRYALATAGGGGQASGDRLGWGASGADRGVASLAHELGHTVGIPHHGHNDWGTLNCKPNYRSLMNYSFASDGFSHGDSGMPDLNPAALNESIGLGTLDASVGMAADPFYFARFGDPASHAVDWNRNGVIESTALVRGGPTWGTWKSCAARNANEQVLSTAEMTATPVVVRLRNRLYALWVGSDGRIRYRQGDLGASLATGSCPGGDDLGDTCMTWSAERTLPTATTVKSLHAATWANRLYVAYRAADSTVRVMSAGSLDISGNPTAWTSETTLPGVTTLREPELHLLEVRIHHFGVKTLLGLFYVQSTTNTYQWATSTDTIKWTVQGDLLDAANAAIPAKQSPNLATAGTTTCGAFTQTDDRVHLRCYNATTNRWVERTAAFAQDGWATNHVKPAFAFHTSRTTEGARIDATGANGHFLLGVRKNVAGGLGVPDILTSTAVNATSPATGVTFPAIGKAKDEWTTTPDGVGIEIYEDLDLSAPKMVVPWKSSALGTPLVFYPLADGSVRTTLSDGNDWYIMERGVCVALRGETFCGSRLTSDNGY
jgi:hypothetical protein